MTLRENRCRLSEADSNDFFKCVYFVSQVTIDMITSERLIISHPDLPPSLLLITQHRNAVQ
ncbi:hypothetical protein OUZ56_006629 [Daphnia magna]|uniref:Uncharacterized protein n=1 Tax=Daphnia magna TaxID=35525 RepID=A0ABQ9YWC9_9CRUS|nr:hypothetical protein OUZ56_006629 [Daphnia magna]